MSSLNSLSNSDLRIATRLLNTLRKDHGVQLGFRDPDLGSKISRNLERLDDPILTALWDALPEWFRSASATGADKIKSKHEAKQLYRGHEPAPLEEKTASAEDAGDSDPSKTGGGKYITYRGTRQWVPD